MNRTAFLSGEPHNTCFNNNIKDFRNFDEISVVFSYFPILGRTSLIEFAAWSNIKTSFKRD